MIYRSKVKSFVEHHPHLVHRGHACAHMSYLSAVAWEAHGIYGIAAAVLLGFVLVIAWAGEEVG